MTPEQQEEALAIVKEIAALGYNVYTYIENHDLNTCFFCSDDFRASGDTEKNHVANHDADCTYLKACNLLKSIEESNQ